MSTNSQSETSWKMILVVILIVLLVYILWDAYVFEDPLTKVAQKVDGAIDRSSGIMVNAAGIVVGKASNVAGAVYDTTSDVAGAVYNTTSDVAGAVYDTTSDVAGAVYDTTSDVAGAVYDTTSDVAGAVYDTTSDVAGAVYDTTSDVAGTVYDTTSDVAGAVYDTTSGVVTSVVNRTGRVIVTSLNAVGDILIYTGEAIRFDRNGNAKIIDRNGKETDISAEEAEDILADNEVVQQEQIRSATEAGIIPSPMEGDMNQDVDKVIPAEEEDNSQLMNVSENSEEIPPFQSTENISTSNTVPSQGVGTYETGQKLDENGNVVEGFYHNYEYPRHCSECGDKGRGSCNNCENCGYCITPDGHGECVSGDSNGPYFRKDCIGYENSANGYRVYKNSPYRYLVGLPYFRRDAYYYDQRGYPKSKYSRKSGRHMRNHSSGSSSHRTSIKSRNSGIVVPKGRIHSGLRVRK